MAADRRRDAVVRIAVAVGIAVVMWVWPNLGAVVVAGLSSAACVRTKGV